MNLPLNLSLQATQTQWSAALNPVLANAILKGNPIGQVVLVANTPKTFGHGLSRDPQGFIVTDINAAAIVYRTQPFNSSTLTIEATANVTIDILVY